MVLLGLVALGTAPLPFLGEGSPRLWLGLPLWLWWSGGFTVLLSALIAWGVLRYWSDDDV